MMWYLRTKVGERQREQAPQRTTKGGRTWLLRRR